jgi:PilZ domain
MSFLRFSTYQNQMDRRVAPRRPVRKAGMIEFPGGAFSCMVQNLSETGAALDVPNSIEIPEHFSLMIIERGDAVRCRSVWRTERQIGVAFEAAG